MQREVLLVLFVFTAGFAFKNYHQVYYLLNPINVGMELTCM